MHLEGPFFTRTRNGAHDSRHVVSPILGLNSITDVYGLSLSSKTTSRDNDDIGGDAMMPTLDDVTKSHCSRSNTAVALFHLSSRVITN